MIPRTLAVRKDSNGNLTSLTGFVGGVGRFGLRANGVELLQFVVGGLQGELSFTSLINPDEINFPTCFRHWDGGGHASQQPARRRVRKPLVSQFHLATLKCISPRRSVYETCS